MRRDETGRPDKERGAHTLRVWRGTIVGISGDDVIVELGPRRQGVISLRAFAEPPAEGESYDFTLRGREESLWALSLADERSLSTWEEMEVGSLVSARVLRLHHEGLQLKVGPLHAWMPRSQTGLPRERKPTELVGRTVTCEVIEVDPDKQRVVVSRKLVLKREKEHRTNEGQVLPGDRVHGRVARIEEYGVFLALPRGKEGLVHVSNLAWERVDHPEEVCKLGDSLEARVLYVKAGGRRIGLGVKQLSESPWKALARDLRPGALLEGTVTRLAEYGAFVRVAGGVEGLLHNSESGQRGKRLREVLRPGQKLSARVVAFEPDDERLSLSLLHTSGARIAPDEANALLDLAALAEEVGADPPGTNLGRLLRRALEEPRADAG